MCTVNRTRRLYASPLTQLIIQFTKKKKSKKKNHRTFLNKNISQTTTKCIMKVNMSMHPFSAFMLEERRTDRYDNPIRTERKI